MKTAEGKKIYFASDAHFGLRLYEDPKDAQRRFVRWIESIEPTCGALFLVGDMFDYWFEYKTVVPKGFTRFLGTVSRLTDQGIPVFIFCGNHDIWMFDYLEKECGAVVVPGEWQGSLLGRNFYVTHGDGLGDPSVGFRFLRCFFRNRVCQWLYRWIHPDVTMPFGYAWAYRNRKRKQGNSGEQFLGEEREFQIKWAKEHLAENPDVDFYVFGHRHIEVNMPIEAHTTDGRPARAQVTVLGDWIQKFTYGEFDGLQLVLKNFDA